jgi:hypothetical protein
VELLNAVLPVTQRGGRAGRSAHRHEPGGDRVVHLAEVDEQVFELQRPSIGAAQIERLADLGLDAAAERPARLGVAERPARLGVVGGKLPAAEASTPLLRS